MLYKYKIGLNRKMLYKYRPFKAVLKSYGKSIKYKENSSKPIEYTGNVWLLKSKTPCKNAN